MKTETIHSLITAKILFENAQRLCAVSDKYQASAGLVILQDAVELVLQSCLIELGVDEKKAIDNLNFDGLISELKNANIEIFKSGRLKTLNKQRVLIKHHGHPAEPATVLEFYNIAIKAVDDLLRKVVGKPLQEIMLSDVIKDDDVRSIINQAFRYFEKKEYYQALVEIRKVIVLTIEHEYSIAGWKNHSQYDKVDIGLLITGGGLKAPQYSKNKEWIEKNVYDPFDYVQLDHEKLRIDLMELGINTQDFWNLWRLTPQVIKLGEPDDWRIKEELKHVREAATEENVRYCLDTVVSIVLKKQNHHDLTRQISTFSESYFIIRVTEEQPLYEKASTNSKVLTKIQKDKLCEASSIVQGFDARERFANIHFLDETKKQVYSGFIAEGSFEILEDD